MPFRPWYQTAAPYALAIYALLWIVCLLGMAGY